MAKIKVRVDGTRAAGKSSIAQLITNLLTGVGLRVDVNHDPIPQDQMITNLFHLTTRATIEVVEVHEGEQFHTAKNNGALIVNDKGLVYLGYRSTAGKPEPKFIKVEQDGPSFGCLIPAADVEQVLTELLTQGHKVDAVFF